VTPEQTLDMAIGLVEQAFKLAAHFGQVAQLKAALRQRMAAMFDDAETAIAEKRRS
jgi:hypothetical protein